MNTTTISSSAEPFTLSRTIGASLGAPTTFTGSALLARPFLLGTFYDMIHKGRLLVIEPRPNAPLD